MKVRFIIFSFTLLLSLPLFAREKTDVIVMKNGDRLTCEIRGLSAGVLSVQAQLCSGHHRRGVGAGGSPGERSAISGTDRGRQSVHR